MLSQMGSTRSYHCDPSVRDASDTLGGKAPLEASSVGPIELTVSIRYRKSSSTVQDSCGALYSPCGMGLGWEFARFQAAEFRPMVGQVESLQLYEHTISPTGNSCLSALANSWDAMPDNEQTHRSESFRWSAFQGFDIGI